MLVTRVQFFLWALILTAELLVTFASHLAWQLLYQALSLYCCPLQSTLSCSTVCFAQAFKLLNGRMIKRQPLRAAYLQRFPSKRVLAEMAAEERPHPTTGAANNAAAVDYGHQAPAAPVHVPEGSLSPAAKVCCSSSKPARQHC